MKQREAVYNAVKSVFSDANINFEDGMDVSTFLTKELRGNVHSIVTEGFTNGTIVFEQNAANQAKLSDTSKLNSYVSGLISNWIRKDRRLNGNVAYVAKNPGSRAGQGDEQLKTLRMLHRQFAATDLNKAAEIQTFIDARVEALRTERDSSAKIDTSTVPAELLESLGLN